jgi:hypothetical protein
MLTLLNSGLVWGQGPPSGTAPSEAQEGAVPEKPKEKPEEKPPLELVIPTKPLAPPPTTTFEVGPATGILAPYSYAPGTDILDRGWQSHKVGILRVFPYLDYTGVYRTNIFQTTTNKKADLVNTGNPGLRLELPLAQRHKISVAYLGNYYWYSYFQHSNHYDHTFNVDGSFVFPAGLSLRLGQSAKWATEDRSAVVARAREYTRIDPYFQASYKFADRWKFDFNYQLDMLGFLKTQDQVSNTQDHAWGATLYYKLFPKTAALLQYILAYRKHPYNQTSDNISHTPLLGLTWDPTAKLSGTIKFGYTYQNYFNPPVGNRSVARSFTMTVQTLYRYSRYTNLSLVLQRANLEDPDTANSGYTNTGAYLSLNHQWTYLNIMSTIFINYYNNSYLNDTQDSVTGQFRKREDNVINTGVGLMRPITKWLKARLDYNYFNKGCNMSNINFNEHRVMFGIQSSF